MNNLAKTIKIIGVPSDLGANMRGSNMGPASLRIANLQEQIKQMGHQVIDLGDLNVPVRESLPQTIIDNKYLEPLENICKSLFKKTQESLQQGHLPLVIGGDHSISIGSISGVSEHYAKQNKKIGLIWVDAHADMNTPESSDSGNIHGMPLATILGEGHSSLKSIGSRDKKVNPENVALIGIRNIDQNEKDVLKKSGIHYFTMREVDERGMYEIMKEAIEYASRDTEGIHVSFDIDGVDPLYAPGVSTAVKGGLSFREAHLILEMVAETKKVSSMDFVELNPFTDEGSRTAELVVELIQSALGKSII